MPKMYCYGRASTDKQIITIANQEEVCQGYFRMKQIQLKNEQLEFGGWFPDAAVTSKIDFLDRPMGNSIANLVQKGDFITVTNFDRMFRSVKDCDRTMQFCEDRGVNLSIMDMDVDTSTPNGRFFAQIISAVKELERKNISIRTREALQFNLRNGKLHKGTPIGWRRFGKTAKPDMQDRMHAKEVVRMHDDRNYDFREIEEVFLRRGAKTPDGGRWHLRRVRLSYSAYFCRFPHLYSRDLPPIRELREYLASHGGRPPQLQHGAVPAGLLHTLPPMPDLPPGVDELTYV